jgi:hypothetical protein
VFDCTQGIPNARSNIYLTLALAASLAKSNACFDREYSAAFDLTSDEGRGFKNPFPDGTLGLAAWSHGRVSRSAAWFER